jgi:hypothetical protein
MRPWNPRELAELMAVRWMKYGRPMEAPYEDTVQLIADYQGIDTEAANDLLYREGRNMVGTFREAQALIETQAFMPPPRPATLRILHNFGLHIPGDENLPARWALLDRILTNGLQSQPEGSGAHSELPTAVFAVVDDPNADLAQRRYNRNFPWIIADLPADAYGNAMLEQQPGWVVTVSAVPPQYVVGVNGMPVSRFMAAARRWGPG